MTDLRQPDRRMRQGFGQRVGTITVSVAFVMELTLLPILLAVIQRDLGLSRPELAWVFNAYGVAVAGAVLVSGVIGDRLDKQKLFATGVIIFALGSLGAAMSEDLRGLLLSRVIQGMGGGLFSPLVPVLLTQASARPSGRILMIWGGVLGIAAAAFPLIGAAVLSFFGWRAIFATLAAVSAIGLVLVLGDRLPTAPQSKKRLQDLGRLLGSFQYWLLLLYIFLTYGSFSTYLFFFPLHWDDRAFNPYEVSLFLTCLWIAFATVNFWLRDHMEGRGLTRALMVSPVLMAAGVLVAAIDVTSSAMQIASAILIGAGLACSNSPSTQLLLRIAPKSLHALSASLDITFARCGSVVMVVLLAEGSLAPMIFAVVAASGIATLAAWYLARVALRGRGAAQGGAP